MNLTHLALASLLALAPLTAQAGPIWFDFSNGNRSATAMFEKSGGNLVVTLTNNSSADALVPTDILTAVFFELSGNPTLTQISAVVPANSSVLVGNSGTNVTPADRVIGGEWAYAAGFNNVPGHHQGISSTGLGVFGPGNRFPGNNLQGPTSPAGLQYGITSAGDNLLTGNGGVSGEHLIKNSVVFTLGNFSGEPDDVISAARFQYGTDLSEPQFEGTPHVSENVPEPTSLAMALVGLAGLITIAWRRRC